ncbi:MAG: DNA polymerase III subunit epsilon [Desulfobulbaceae bacterium A2]|nr:MAG: DNA polymerase III subunit epsilon [Desulfobulbaceae bacterium A2]
MPLTTLAGLFRTPHPLLVENKKYFQELNQFRPAEEYEFVVLDTELTGLHERRDEIVSIGAVRVKGLQIVMGDAYHAHVKPSKPLPKDSTLIHRITPQQLENAPSLREVLPSFIDYCGQSLLVGHFVDLDTAFLNRATRKLFGSPFHNPCVDTLRLAQIYLELSEYPRGLMPPEGPSFALADLSRLFELPPFTPHNALQDAIQTAYLFIFLIKKFQLLGFRTLREIFRARHHGRWAL